MKNNTINEITRIKKLMLINEASIIKWKFGETFQPKITSKLNGMNDAEVKAWNIEVKKPNPYRQGVDVIEKIDTKAKLLAELNNFNYDLRNLTQPQKDFLVSLNRGMGQIDPKYIDDLVTEFKPSYKSADDATRGEFLAVYKSILTETQAVKFEKEIQGFTIKAGILPVLKDIIKGSKEFIAPFLKDWRFWVALPLVTSGVAGGIYKLIMKGGNVFTKTIDEAVTTKGAKLLKLILDNEDLLTNGTPDDIASAYGITDENKIKIDEYAQDFFKTQNLIDTTENEVEELITNLTSNFDGVNFIYFLSKFKNISGKKLIGFLFDEGIKNINDIVNKSDIVSPVFEFYTVMDTDIETIKSIDTVLGAITTSYGGVDGYSQMLIKQDSRNENSEWVPFNNTDANITLNVINQDGEAINFDYTTRTNILKHLKIYIDSVWENAGSVNKKEAIANVFNGVVKDKKIPNTDDLLELSLDPITVYTEVSNELMKKHPEFSRITFTWPWVQKIRENVVGLARILKEEPILGPKKKVSTNNTGVKTFPGPGTVQEFQDWLDTHYPTWLNGGKLNRGTGYGNYGGNTQKAFGIHSTEYQQSLTSGGNVNPPATEVDKEKQIFDKYNDLFFFYSKNNEIMNIEYTKQIGKWIKYFVIQDYNLTTAYLGSVLSSYGNNISKYKTDEKTQLSIDYYLPDLQNYLKTLFEGIQIKKLCGLALILEQQVRPLVVVNVVNGIPKKQTDDDNYKDAYSITIKSIIGGGTELRKGDKSDTIVRVKEALGYTKDTTPYFTQDFDTFVIKYKGTNKLDNTNGNISKDLMCSIEQYKQLCLTSSGQKTTAPPTNTTTTTSTPIELKYLNDYATAVGNGVPAYGTCKSLFDYYSEQALNYRRLKKVNQAPKITATDLKPIQDKILYCQKSSDLKDRAKLDTLISQRFRIQQDKDSPYYLDI